MAGERSFAKLNAKRADLEWALEDRLKDAEALFKARRYASSIAMGLYALEIGLKIAICRRLDLDALPAAFEIHDIQGLVVLAGLQRRLHDPASASIKVNWDALAAFGVGHVNDLRYLPSGLWSRAQARDVLDRLQAPPDGVLPWITARL
ncbi:MAG TPA: hypothetical protein VGH33_07700 [Isosphaeraceae bacterium]|jgi:hypothetical protein